MNYHREFLRTQAIAAQFAKKFNEKINDLDGSLTQTELRTIPRIKFLEPLVFELYKGEDEFNVLIEEYLEGRYVKFNNNMGYVQNDNNPTDAARKLEIIEEDEYDSDDSNDYYYGDSDDESYMAAMRAHADQLSLYYASEPDSADIPDKDTIQAFSHFTFEESKTRLIVVDLQGVLQVNKDGTRQFVLTDPAIHKKTTSCNSVLGGMNFGRTDRGAKGIDAFFKSHKCTEFCKMLRLVTYEGCVSAKSSLSHDTIQTEVQKFIAESRKIVGETQKLIDERQIIDGFRRFHF